ncbi:hypothetical protein ZHAS_00015742 [Anopheles sinensis]|uniref:Uncharacterized protein n=1 Tax=Anopheles sinensis TaxID=74873 RepID=A0A084WBV0_ANOSI|nr:hypothetical protein ZHAS_00015742 [Anopheles sinensis]
MRVYHVDDSHPSPWPNPSIPARCGTRRISFIRGYAEGSLFTLEGAVYGSLR